MRAHPARRLPRGLAYLVAHGHAADGSHAQNTVPTQHLVNPPHHNPTRNDVVDSWVHLRAQRGDPLTASTGPAAPPAVYPEGPPGADDRAVGGAER
jgi:hypothetical protein